jgi:RsmE family RNA methyltransferase
MNLILISPQDFINENNVVRLAGRRHRHIWEVLKAKAGSELCVGLINEKMGIGRVISIDDKSVTLEMGRTSNPPKALPLTLILALPRPQVIKRVLQCASSLGVKKIILLNFFRVEKSLWQSSSLKEDAIHEQLILGLEQAKDTVLPEVILRKRFKAFADDELPGLIKGTLPLAAHPGAVDACPQGIKQPVTLLIGPEGGLIDDELQKLKGLGFRAVDLGSRILKVESVLPFVVGKLF